MKCKFDELIDRQNTHCVKWDGLLEHFGKDNIIPMWVADMDFRPPAEVVRAITNRAQHGIYGYEYKSLDYHQSFIDWLAKRHNWQVNSNWITPCPGVVPGLTMALLALTEPGESVVIQPPVYAPFYRIVEENNRHVVENPLQIENGVYKMDFIQLEQLFQKGSKVLLLCSPHNPVGRVWTRDELKKLENLTAKYGVLVLSDEIWSDLILTGHKHIPVASLSHDMAARTITFMAPSKTFNLAGLHLANTIISNDELRNRFQEQMQKLSLNHMNIFGMTASQTAYKTGEPWLNQLIDYLEQNISYTISELTKITTKIKVFNPESTYVLWLDCRELGIPFENLNGFFAKNAGIALTDGQIFGRAGSGFQRMNIGCPKEMIAEAMERLAKVL